ncbi:uncharacterized protein [Aristolochia californica]|uniref:uncharacterized protein n=1 Tax=Aristolochia californica TaxID=171875 RepID=UPI0035D8ECB8
MGTDRQETHDSSCYFPGCRKDMNCHCEICLASIEATLDLKCSGAQKVSRAKVLQSNATPDRATISSVSWAPSTPEIRARSATESPLRSTAKSKRTPEEKIEKQQKRQWIIRSNYWRGLVCLSLILVAEFGFRKFVTGVIRPVLSPEIVQTVGEDTAFVPSLEGRLAYLQTRIEEIVQVKISNCCVDDSMWELNQDGYLLHSRCTLYRSKAEEVSIWGWPLQTAGLLVTSFSSRSFTIICGRMTEWPDGNIGFIVRNLSSSWTQKKWRLSPLQIDPNTWILEYKKAALLQNPRLLSIVIDILTSKRMWRKIIKQDFWQWTALTYQQYYNSKDVAGESFKHPT